MLKYSICSHNFHNFVSHQLLKKQLLFRRKERKEGTSIPFHLCETVRTIGKFEKWFVNLVAPEQVGFEAGHLVSLPDDQLATSLINWSWLIVAKSLVILSLLYTPSDSVRLKVTHLLIAVFVCFHVQLPTWALISIQKKLPRTFQICASKMRSCHFM